MKLKLSRLINSKRLILAANPTKEDILKFQKKFNLEYIPEIYVYFLMNYNGGRFNERIFRSDKGIFVASDFLSISTKTYSLYTAMEFFSSEEGFENLIPFAEDQGGNMFLFESDDQNPVYFFDHHSGYVEVICSSLELFFNSLTVDN